LRPTTRAAPATTIAGAVPLPWQRFCAGRAVARSAAAAAESVVVPPSGGGIDLQGCDAAAVDQENPALQRTHLATRNPLCVQEG